jgi:hypothetical protein
MTDPDANKQDICSVVTTHLLLAVMVASFMSKVRTQYQQVTAAPVEAQ